VAVKLLTDPHWGPLLVGREAALLARLAGRGATRLVGSEVGPAGAWIATEWVAGVPVDLHARRLRGSTDEVTGRRAVAAALLNAYAKVHGSGVLHGDVHAGNAIRRPDGTVTLIDLGLGRLDGEPDDGTLPRAFATDHLDPVTARALLAGEPPPAPTLAAERYAVATLAFELVTGSPAHRPATTVEDARRAVLAPGFRRFADVGTPAWPAGERVLRRLAGLPG
jgi:serine/threonine protein kinase